MEENNRKDKRIRDKRGDESRAEETKKRWQKTRKEGKRGTRTSHKGAKS